MDITKIIIETITSNRVGTSPYVYIRRPSEEIDIGYG